MDTPSRCCNAETTALPVRRREGKRLTVSQEREGGGMENRGNQKLGRMPTWGKSMGEV